MRLSRLAFLMPLLALATGQADSADGQPAVSTHPADYGKLDIPRRQSLGDAAQTVSSRGDVFEPIRLLPEYDRLRQIARAIVRLDIQLSTGVNWCTGAIVDKSLVLTNYHCIPGFGDIRQASIVLDYLQRGSPSALRLRVSAEPLQADEELDYALMPILDPLPAEILPLRLVEAGVRPGQRLVIVHHPAGEVKMMTQFKCLAHHSEPEREASVRHICDTMQGSSGGILLDPDKDYAPVALHHSGGLNPNDPESFNEATALVAISQHSPELLAIAASPERPPSDSPPGGEEAATHRGASGEQHREVDGINRHILGVEAMP